MSAAAISSVAIVGGGIVGWSAAAALKRWLPALTVTVVPVPPPPDALADRIASTLPSTVEFHDDLGLTDADTVVRSGSSYRLGTRFEGWAGGKNDYVHAYGEYGQPLAGAAFHQHWLRAAQAGRVAPFADFSSAAAMALRGRFVTPEAMPKAQLPAFTYGLQIDPVRYREMMRAFALHLGAIERRRPAPVAGVRLRGGDGFVDALEFEDTEEVAADLFIDASGPAALVRSKLDDQWEDWSRWLACNRIVIAEAAPLADVPPLDRVTAMQAGWRWEAASPARTSWGLVYSSRHLSSSEAERELPGGADIGIRAGRRVQPWLRNCVAIGDAAVGIEPLEWTNLHLAHSAIDRIVAMMPDRDCSAVELWDYNRQATAEADRVRDFVLLHYLASNRAEPFWSEAAAVEPPASLAHTLSQFRERGRLPFFEEETFSRDSWVAVLLGQGVRPRRVDPLVDSVTPQESLRALTQLRAAIQAAVQQLPTHAQFLHQLSRQANR